MSWLKKIGVVALQMTQAITGFGPLISAMIPGTRDDKLLATVQGELPKLLEIIASIEIAGAALNLPGAQKLEAAAPLFAQVILQSSAMAGKKIKDQVLFTKSVKEIASGMAGILNSLDEGGVKAENKA